MTKIQNVEILKARVRNIPIIVEFVSFFIVVPKNILAKFYNKKGYLNFKK